MKKLFLIVVTGIVLASCANNQTEKKAVELTVSELKKEEANLIETSRKWAKFKTSEEYLSYVGNDALMMAPDEGIIRGHKSIAEALKRYGSIPGFTVAWEPQEAFISKSGDLGYLLDRLLITFDGEDGKPIKLFEKGISIWKKNTKNEWKMAVDIWNVDKTISSIYK